MVGQTLLKRLGAAGAVALAGLAVAASAASAGTITVNITVDEYNDTNTGCSLREAITAAQTDLDGNFAGCQALNSMAMPTDDDADTIVLGSGLEYELTRTGALEDSNASGDLDIASVAGDAQLTIQTSGAARARIDGNGDGLADPDAVVETATLDRVIDATVTGNDLTLLKLSNLDIFDGNATSGGGGGISGVDGALGNLQIENSRIYANKATTADGAGGIDLTEGTTTITDSAIFGNTADAAAGSGGGINARTNAQTVEVRRSTVSGNTSYGGGGLSVRNGTPTLKVINSTVYDNDAAVGGGGIGGFVGTTILSNATVAGNSGNDGGGVFVATAGTLSARNSIIADNIDTIADSNPDCFENGAGDFTSGGYNLIETPGDCVFTVSNDLIGMDPALGGLASNGGPTSTMALLAGSPAINAANPGAPDGNAPNCETTDQRGVTRPVSGRCDIGAFEFQPPSPPGGGGSATTGLRAAALKKCAKKKSKKAKKKCKKRARRLPI